MKILLCILMSALLAMTAGCELLSAEAPQMEQIAWKFNRLDNIGGVPTHVEGHPQIISTPAGKAVAFNGVDDALFIDRDPLAGASSFAVEAIFRPDGGAFEQRWMHLAEIDPSTREDSGTRLLFEIRVVGDRWYLDAFVAGPATIRPWSFRKRPFPSADGMRSRRPMTAKRIAAM